MQHGAWLSLVERELWELDVAGSNPAAPIARSFGLSTKSGGRARS